MMAHGCQVGKRQRTGQGKRTETRRERREAKARSSAARHGAAPSPAGLLIAGCGADQSTPRAAAYAMLAGICQSQSACLPGSA
ncbi:hypothetical protein WN55_06384 [Dufourea novaeangliae]|uniref:Uncharacterized protein n=1 Tax=Dufourea novaeangliae TaxID=178035 RepID=A0A154PQJ3_DUFNO|nr:hypothetical protein WN55_06384 [Dufourea novaeangliae]